MNIKVACRKIERMEKEKAELVKFIDIIKSNPVLSDKTRNEMIKNTYTVHDSIMDSQNELEDIVDKLITGVTIKQTDTGYIVEHKEK